MRHCLFLIALLLVGADSSFASPVAASPGDATSDRNGAVSSPTGRLAPVGILEAAIEREAARHAREHAVLIGGAGVQQQAAKSQRGWIGRHPVLFGAFVGAATGTALSAAAWGKEGAFVGFYSGGAVGAAVGALVR